MCCTCVQRIFHIITNTMLYDLTCTECNISYSSASSLLKHFAQHANDIYTNPPKTNKSQKNGVPDLHPINTKLASEEDTCESNFKDDCLQFCAINMNDLPDESSNHVPEDKLITRPLVRKYKCSYCLKAFGWSTDLKRHILTHTGERPFKCKECDSSFTRKFLLQKHYIKQHRLEGISNSTSHSELLLKPHKLFKQKSRKQDKEKIKRKVLNAKNACQTVSEVSDNLLCLS